VKFQFLASRWALKEAVVKACGDGSLKYPGIYLIKRDGKKKPEVEIEGDHNIQILFKDLEVSAIHASISHEEHYATAFVVMETLKEITK
jgi:holo-[acyl-carrier protein] synthase